MSRGGAGVGVGVGIGVGVSNTTAAYTYNLRRPAERMARRSRDPTGDDNLPLHHGRKNGDGNGNGNDDYGPGLEGHPTSTTTTGGAAGEARPVGEGVEYATHLRMANGVGGYPEMGGGEAMEVDTSAEDGFRATAPYLLRLTEPSTMDRRKYLISRHPRGVVKPSLELLKTGSSGGAEGVGGRETLSMDANSMLFTHMQSGLYAPVDPKGALGGAKGGPP